jgi:hypothetical protein
MIKTVLEIVLGPYGGLPRVILVVYPYGLVLMVVYPCALLNKMVILVVYPDGLVLMVVYPCAPLKSYQ